MEKGLNLGEHMGKVAAEIHARLSAALAPTILAVIDDSAQHRGHAGHRGDAAESHFTVEISAAAFVGQSRIARQRAVYAALGELVAHDRVHALRIIAKAPEEA
jgi:BolA family transcriptional regulator, general stress-responsive regulator